MPDQPPFTLHDFFGDQPHRPDHADYWRLSEILLGLDAGLDPSASQQAADEAFAAKMASLGVDQTSLTYAAMQRSMRLLGVQTMGDLLDKFSKVSQMAAAWMDGFAAGHRYPDPAPAKVHLLMRDCTTDHEFEQYHPEAAYAVEADAEAACRDSSKFGESDYVVTLEVKS